MPLNFAIYLKLLVNKMQNRLDYLITILQCQTNLSVTMSDLGGRLVGNCLSSFNALLISDVHILGSSSETLSENLKHLNVHQPKHKKPESDDDFGYYLAGLIEGGEASHINLNRNPNNKGTTLLISFNIKDIRLAYYIKSKLGFGSVRKVTGKDGAAVIYGISNKEGVFKVLDLINGKIRTPTILNQITKNISYPITLLPLDNSLLTNNYWLAGFCDADASFQVQAQIFNRKGRSKPEIRLSLQIDAKFRFVLDMIRHDFSGRIGHRKKLNTYYYSSVSFGGAYKLISYFRVYHLLSSKYINYLKWCKVYQYIESKQHLTTEGISKILALAARTQRAADGPSPNQ
nr:LAGLIDADG endonuclease [Synchytrium endobioticum]